MALTIAPTDFANVFSLDKIKYQTGVDKIHISPHILIEGAGCILKLKGQFSYGRL